MATVFPIPPKAEETYGGFRQGVLDALTKMLGGAYQAPEEAAPDLSRLLGAVGIPGTMKEALSSGMIGMGPMPLFQLRTSTSRKFPDSLYIEQLTFNKPEEGRAALKEILARAEEIKAQKIVGVPLSTTNHIDAPWQKTPMDIMAERFGAKPIKQGEPGYWEFPTEALKAYLTRHKGK